MIKGPKKCGYTDLLDYALLEKAKEKEEKLKNGELKINPLRPSASGKCSRALALELDMYRNGTYYPRDPMEPNISRLLDLGHSVEFHVLKQFRLLEVLPQKYKQQVLSFFPIERGDKKFESDLLEGQCDFVLYSDKHKCIGDVKSKKDGFSYTHKSKWEENLEKYSKMKSVESISETSFWIEDLETFLAELGYDFMSDNFYQLNLYANSKFMKDRDVDHALLYYYNKNDSRHFEMRFNPSESLYEKVKDKFNRVSVAVDKGQIPEECDFPEGTIRHAFCDCMKMKPYGDEAPTKKWFKTLPKKRWPRDLEKVPNSAELTALFEDYEELVELIERKEKVELEIIEKLLTARENYIKLDNGNIYRVKHLKSPRPHYELRRSKL